MSYSVDSSPSVFSSLTPTSLTAREEIFTFINHTQKKAVIFDFERRRVNSRCIVRVIDYSTRTVSEKRSRTLRFNIKSAFAERPFEDEGITFTGGGFTASAVTKDNTTRIIAALPEMELPGGTQGFKAQLSFTLNPDNASFNQLYTKGRFTEAVHSSLSPSASGTLIIGGRKIQIDPGEHTAERVWKTTTFPIKRDYYSSYCYGHKEKPFSFTLSVEERKCVALIDDALSFYDGIEMKKESEDEYTFTDGKKINIHFSVFAVVREKTGPFRENRTLKYGVFGGNIREFEFSESFGCIEL